MERVRIERVWGEATVKGGGLVLKTVRGVVHMAPLDLPCAAVRMTVRSNLGSSAEVWLTLEDTNELIADLKACAFDG